MKGILRKIKKRFQKVRVPIWLILLVLMATSALLTIDTWRQLEKRCGNHDCTLAIYEALLDSSNINERPDSKSESSK